MQAMSDMQEENKKNQESLVTQFQEMDSRIDARLSTMERKIELLAEKDAVRNLEQRLEVLEAKNPWWSSQNCLKQILKHWSFD